MKKGYWIMVLMISSLTAMAKVKLPAVFSNGMVLQQKEQVVFWGWASAGETITLKPGWSKKMTTVTANEKGEWKVHVQTGAAGGPYTIVFTGENTVELKDVLLGEVWLCSGQSNMGYTLKASEGAKEEISQANYPQIRYFSIKRQYGLQEFADCPGSVWEKTSSTNAGSYSAVAYFFAKKIHIDKNTPVGIIFSAWGGTPAEAWTPAGTLRSDSVLKKYFDRWATIQTNVGKDSAAYHVLLAQWEKNRNTVDSNKIKKPEEPQTLYYYKRPWREPSVLFNGMIDPVIPYAIKGVLWYQGESNVGYASEYAQLFGAMINSWRERWSSAGYTSILPFYFVQLAAFGYSDLDAAARLREGQQQVADKMKATGMAVAIDLGDMKDIHFTRKKEVGERLAYIALARTYGHKKQFFQGPYPSHIKQVDGKALLQYKGAPLVIKGDIPQGFEIGFRLSGTDSIQFKKADARLEKGVITVWHESVAQPVAVRYGWLLPGEVNIFDTNHLPASPFTRELR